MWAQPSAQACVNRMNSYCACLDRLGDDGGELSVTSSALSLASLFMYTLCELDVPKWGLIPGSSRLLVPLVLYELLSSGMSMFVSMSVFVLMPASVFVLEPVPESVFVLEPVLVSVSVPASVSEEGSLSPTWANSAGRGRGMMFSFISSVVDIVC